MQTSQIRSRARLLLPLTLLIVASLACSLFGGDPPPAPTPVPPVDPPVQPPSSGAIRSLQDVQSATIQIEAQGTFIDPEFGLLVNAAGRGSGFIIDPSGIAVTNNHVVTGAALLQVWVGGESQPRNARILGVSECSDLAVIDIEGDGYPFLEWHSGDVGVGFEIYAAGYPLGDPEFTLTKGIIAKADASGETSWASVDGVLMHDAVTNPGNSGGPLVSEDGKVVAVNYAGSSVTDQYFSIKAETAIPIINRLQSGEDVNSIGINGVAVRNEDGSITGIWVSSVASGSAADQAGVSAGDILTTMEGLVLATDGTMSAYCDILRTHSAGDTLSIEILRWASGEYLAGQLNGRPLEVAFSFENQLGEQVADTPSNGAAGTYSGYSRVTDDFGAIVVEVPVEWSEVDGRPWVDGGEVIGSSIYASADIDGFLSTWNEPGLIFNVSDDLARLGGYIQLLDIITEGFTDACKFDGRYDYEDPFYRGKYDLYTNCGGPGGAWFIVLTAVPNDNSNAFLILVEVQILSDADLDALDRILNTFDVVGALP